MLVSIGIESSLPSTALSTYYWNINFNNFLCAANLDPYKHSNIDLAKVHILTYETLLCDEVTQITGVVHFGNCLGVSPAVITYFSPKEFYTLLRWGEVS